MGTLNLAAPLVSFEKSRLWAGTRFHLLPSFHHHHPTQHNYTTQTVTLTVILTSTFSHTLYTHPTRNVVCPSSAWIENRPHSTPSIHPAWNSKHVIVQWVGIGTHTFWYRQWTANQHRELAESTGDWLLWWGYWKVCTTLWKMSMPEWRLCREVAGRCS